MVNSFSGAFFAVVSFGTGLLEATGFCIAGGFCEVVGLVGLVGF